VLANELGREPTLEELARRTDIPTKKVQLILESSSKPLSLETPVGEDSQLIDVLEDVETISPESGLLGRDLTARVESALAILSPRESEILRLRFGIGTGRARTLAEVGQSFGVSRERIRQIEANTFQKLRQRGQSLKVLIEK